MEYEKSRQLKEEWGKKHCDHPHFEKVYYTGAFLMNYVCTQCGADFTISEKLEFDELRRRNRR